MLRLQEDAANFPSVARLNASLGLACWEDDQTYDYLVCATLTLGGTALSMGATTTVRSASTMQPSVMALGETSAVVCYYDTSSYRVRCNALAVGSDGSLTVGGYSDLYSSYLYTSYSNSLVTAALDSTHGAACLRSSGSYSYCYVLTVSGTSLSIGGSATVSYSSATTLTMSAFDELSAVLCYRESNVGRCKVLTRSGASATSFSAGSDLTFYSSTIYSGRPMSVTTLTDQRAIVCYVTNSGVGQCHLVVRASASATSLSAIGPETFAEGSPHYVSMDALDDELTLVCYSDTSNNAYGMCKRVWVDGDTMVVGDAVVAHPSSITDTSVAGLDSEEQEKKRAEIEALCDAWEKNNWPQDPASPESAAAEKKTRSTILFCVFLL